MPVKEGFVSKLDDGRILWVRPTFAVVWDGKAWVPPKGVTFGASMDSRPLSEAEIADLEASWISFQ